MNTRVLRATAIATIVVFLLALGLGDVIAYFLFTPGHHLKGWVIAAVGVFAVAWGYLFYVLSQR
jgi:hypothetical protein